MCAIPKIAARSLFAWTPRSLLAASTCFGVAPATTRYAARSEICGSHHCWCPSPAASCAALRQEPTRCAALLNGLVFLAHTLHCRIAHHFLSGLLSGILQAAQCNGTGTALLRTTRAIVSQTILIPPIIPLVECWYGLHRVAPAESKGW